MTTMGLTATRRATIATTAAASNKEAAASERASERERDRDRSAIVYKLPISKMSAPQMFQPMQLRQLLYNAYDAGSLSCLLPIVRLFQSLALEWSFV